MAIITQPSLFSWKEIEELGDLERLRIVLEWLPDEELMRKLEKERKNGRNDYPIRGVWNSLLAGIVFEHASVESLRRELSRNGQLRDFCGLEAVPPAYVYSRFMKKLMKQEAVIEGMFHTLVEQLFEVLPDFGKDLAIDSKAIHSYARSRNANETADGRRDIDADYGKKVYRGVKADGSLYETIKKWFGYKLHLIVDANHELPIGYTVTKASRSDVKGGHALLDETRQKHPEIMERAETMMGDRGYDDTKLIKRLWDEDGIKPVIDMREMWQDRDSTRLMEGYTNVTYSEKGQIYCHCPVSGKAREMVHQGFEKDRGTLKKGCPARQYGIHCEGRSQCPVASGLRIPLERDRRRFTPIDRSTYKWKKCYKKRTAVERVNSRLDTFFGLEHHTIRGQKKMQVRCGLSLCVMLAMALGRIREKQPQNMRRFTAA